jgi:hypothetical protein
VIILQEETQVYGIVLSISVRVYKHPVENYRLILMKSGMDIMPLKVTLFA